MSLTIRTSKGNFPFSARDGYDPQLQHERRELQKAIDFLQGRIDDLRGDVIRELESLATSVNLGSIQSQLDAITAAIAFLDATKQDASDILDGISSLVGNGILVRTSADEFATRALNSTNENFMIITNEDGVDGAPYFAINEVGIAAPQILLHMGA